MKVFRFIALGLLIPLSVLAVLAVYLNAQDSPRPTLRKVPEPPGPTFVREAPGRQNQISGHRIQFYESDPDPKLSDEQVADQEARYLAAQFAEAPTDEKSAEVKKKLREKLSAIFEMQQKRRAAEIASIEERLARLKDVSKKREANKDPIVDRRLEQLTGGVDDLGWEDSNRGAVRYSAGQSGGYIIEQPNSNNFGVPTTTPRFPVPTAEPPATPAPAK